MKAEIGNRLKKMRMERGLTQKELAATVQGGLDYTYIGKIERGEQLPSLKMLIKISEALSVPIGYFFRDETSLPVDTGCCPELGDLSGNVQGRELLKVLGNLHQDDVPLVSEIIKVLNRHRVSSAKKLLNSPGEYLLAAEDNASYKK